MTNNEITQEDWYYAKSLYDSLTQELLPLYPGIVFANTAEGLKWSCSLTLGNRPCFVLCFILNKPLYEMRFDQNSEIQAWGNTYQKSDVLSSVKKWLQGEDLPALCEEFEFIDEHQRSLRKIEDILLRQYPEINHSTVRQLRHRGNDCYELYYEAQDRSCSVTATAHGASVDFYWGETNLFQAQHEIFERVGLAIKRWLIDQAMPSSLEKEFDWIDTGKLAKYYEEGQEIIGDFVLSWDQTENSYYQWATPTTPGVDALIKEMRQRGYDRTLRAGTSLYTLIVSRSRRNGLREHQPNIAFNFYKGSIYLIINIDREEKIVVPKIEFTAEIDAQLKKLEACKID